MSTLRSSPSGKLFLVDSDFVENESSVPGLTVTEALNYLLAASTTRLFDEFLGGTNVTLIASNDTGQIGSLAWNFITSGGSIARNVTDQECIGAYDLTGNAAQISAIQLMSNGAPASGFPIDVINRVAWRVRPGTVHNGGATLAGIGQLPGTSVFGTEGIWFQTSTGSPFWQVVARRSGISTPLTTNVPWNTGLPFDLVMTRNASNNWSYFINNVLVGSQSGAIFPTGRQLPSVQVQAVAAGAETATIDSWDFDYTKISLVTP
jgi:hypothetical protein